MIAKPPSAPLARLFDPRSVAVVGASAAPEKAGYQLLKTVTGFSGAVYPVNPREDEILGLTTYPDLAAIPGPVDLVVLVLPPHHSPALLRDAAAVGAGAALIVSGGFGESGADGIRLQDEILGICRDGGIRLLGPNTSGFIRPPRGLYCTFVPPITDIAPGGISIVAQSGGLNVTLAYLAHHEGLGIGLAAGLGNAADVDIAEVIDYLADDADTEIIALQLEGVPDGRGLYDSVARATQRKPVVALPVGRADLGGFAESHTGNLIGNFALTRAALVQAGAVIVETTTDLVDTAHALSLHRLAPAADPGVGVLTSQAGPGLLMTDRLRHAGIRVPELSAPSIERIAGLLPPMHFVRNPVDTGRPSETYGDILATMAGDDAVDAVVVFALLEEHALDPVAAIGGVLASSDKPILFGTGGATDMTEPVRAALASMAVPCYGAPDRAAQGMLALVEDSRAAWRRARDRTTAPPPPAEPLGPGPIDEDAAKALIEAAGIATPLRTVCATHAEAHAALAEFGGPVVVKILDAAITHKTEIGGVQLGVVTSADLDRALVRIDAIATEAPRRYLIEAMAAPGLEVIIGGANDAGYGPTVLLGLGGTAAEALGDVTLRLAPLGAAEAAAMADDLRGRALFDGWRGAPRLDRAALARAIRAVGSLMAAHPEIRELDLNPVRVYGDGVLALDALVVL